MNCYDVVSGTVVETFKANKTKVKTNIDVYLTLTES